MYENIQDWIDNTSTKEKETHLNEYLKYNGDVENLSYVDNLLYDEDNIPRGYHLNEERIREEFDMDMDYFIDFVNQL